MTDPLQTLHCNFCGKDPFRFMDNPGGLLPEDAKIARLEAMIDNILDVSVYPKSCRVGPNHYDKRTDWMEGWNAAVTEMIRRYVECANPEWELPEKEEDDD